jgi:hypothetical protein
MTGPVKPTWLAAPRAWTSKDAQETGAPDTITVAWRMLYGVEMADEKIVAEHDGSDHVARLFASGRVAIIGVEDEIRDTGKSQKVSTKSVPPSSPFTHHQLEHLFHDVMSSGLPQSSVKVFPGSGSSELIDLLKNLSGGSPEADEELADLVAPTAKAVSRFLSKADDRELFVAVDSLDMVAMNRMLGFIMGRMSAIIGVPSTNKLMTEIMDKMSAAYEVAEKAFEKLK